MTTKKQPGTFNVPTLLFGASTPAEMLGGRSLESLVNAYSAVASTSQKGALFLATTHVPGLTDNLRAHQNTAVYQTITGGDTSVEYIFGHYPVGEVGIPFLDHGLLYGDGGFEGLIDRGDSVFLLKEHLDRLYDTLEVLKINPPIKKEEFGWQILQAIKNSAPESGEVRYIRPIVTRGTGDLGINPEKTIFPTMGALAATISLYPPEKYTEGIEVTVATKNRQGYGGNEAISDPNIKATQYLNHIFALMEGKEKNRSALETIMLTDKGYVAEATVDNLFVLRRNGQSGEMELHTPSEKYVLPGLTRAFIMYLAEQNNYKVIVDEKMTPADLLSADEVFMTGTGAGVVPIVKLDGKPIGTGAVGDNTKKFVKLITDAMHSGTFGININATEEEFKQYMAASRFVQYKK